MVEIRRLVLVLSAGEGGAGRVEDKEGERVRTGDRGGREGVVVVVDEGDNTEDCCCCCCEMEWDGVCCCCCD